MYKRIGHLEKDPGRSYGGRCGPHIVARGSHKGAHTNPVFVHCGRAPHSRIEAKRRMAPEECRPVLIQKIASRPQRNLFLYAARILFDPH
jgi:hypothetical protein